MAVTLPLLEKGRREVRPFVRVHGGPRSAASPIDTKGEALPDSTVEVCRKAEAILFGSVGGPKWESLPPNRQPERAALLPLRKIFGLYANLRPALCYKELIHASPIKNSLIPDGFDILVVRELIGGIYFGKPKETTTIERDGRTVERAVDTLVYETPEIERITHAAFKAGAGAAQARDSRRQGERPRIEPALAQDGEGDRAAIPGRGAEFRLRGQRDAGDQEPGPVRPSSCARTCSATSSATRWRRRRAHWASFPAPPLGSEGDVRPV